MTVKNKEATFTMLLMTADSHLRKRVGGGPRDQRGRHGRIGKQVCSGFMIENSQIINTSINEGKKSKVKILWEVVPVQHP